MLKLLRGWLTVGVLDASGYTAADGSGTPQGSPISPLLANIALHVLDVEFAGRRNELGVLARYADDYVVVCSSRRQVAQLLDDLGYHAVDIGTLADSWCSEPNTPVYVQPYLPARPEVMSDEEAQRWFFETPGVPVPAQHVKELVGAAIPGSAGGSRSALADN